MTYVREIFTSIQGEGPFVGYKQLFIRFCSCNLHCVYCDTDFDISKAKDFTVHEIVDICNKNLNCHSVSLTGGEPLLEYEFIKELSKGCKLPLYLETNGTLVNELKEVINCVQYISADIKLSSCTGNIIDRNIQNEFFAIASKKLLFAKSVFDMNITDNEIEYITELCKKYDIELVLQPKMDGNNPAVNSNIMFNVLNRCLKNYSKVRLIPQVHKFINLD